MRDIRRFSAGLLLSILCFAPALVGQENRNLHPIRILPPQPPEPLVRAGPEPDLEVLFTSEVRGFYQPCG